MAGASSAGAALGLEGPHQFAGDRAAVRLGSVAEALRVLRRMAATPSGQGAVGASGADKRNLFVGESAEEPPR